MSHWNEGGGDPLGHTENDKSGEPTFFPDKRPEGDELLQELEESMPQGVPNDTGHRRRTDDPVVDNDLAELDSLLLESVGAVEAERQYKLDRESKKRGYAGLSKEEVDFCNSRMHAFEMAREWDAVQAIAVFSQFTCMQCETTRTIFSRFMEYHQHRRVASTNRWLSVESTKLETSPVLEDRSVPVCRDCVGETLGFELGEDTPWFEDVVTK